MKILHTSDWHLGKKLEGFPRINEQKEILDEIAEIAEKENVDLVIAAGDVYDTFVPQSEAEDLFFDSAVKLSANGRILIIISGNHDDALRLSASDPLAEKSGIYIAGGEIGKTRSAPSCCKRLKFICGGENYFVFEDKNGQKVYINALSYPTEARVNEKVIENESYTEKIARWINDGFKNNIDGLPEILVSHLFMLGGEKSGSEREIELGGTRIVPPSVIPQECLYTALGHLHKRQIVSKERNIIYSGAIAEYSFDEAGIKKSVTVFDIDNGKLNNLHEAELKRGRKLANISAVSVEDAEKLLEKYKDYYVSLTLELNRPLEYAENKKLRQTYPNIVSLILSNPESGENSDFKSRRELSDRDLFVEFYKSRYGSEPESGLIELYLSILNEEREKL